MKIIIKTLKNVKHEIEMKEEDSVADLKQEIAALNMAEVDTQKLLYKGRVLRDSQKTGEFGDGAEIILMRARKKKVKKAKVVTTQDENSSVGVNSPNSSNAEPSIKDLDAEGVYKMVMRKRLEEASQKKLKELVGRGFDEPSAIQALSLSKGDVDLAESYLRDGIPVELANNFSLSDEQKEQVARSIETKKKIEQMKNLDPEKMTPEQKVEMLGKMREDALHVQKQVEEEFARTNDTQGMPARLAMMMGVPGLMQNVLSNPQVRAQIVGLMAKDMPELYARFMANPDEVGETEQFQRAVFTILGRATSRSMPQQATRPTVVRFTEQESAALTALAGEFSMFNRQQCAQAFMGCGKNFEQTRAFLSQHAANASSQAS